MISDREKVCFVKCDTRVWEDQVKMFEAAASRSPNNSVDIVIANAGVGRGAGDPMMQLEGMLPARFKTHMPSEWLSCKVATHKLFPDPFSTPTKPSTHIIDINLVGALYTFKCAVHYFRRSPLNEERDRCFIFIGSVAGYVDNLVTKPYPKSGPDMLTCSREAGSTRQPSLPSEALCELFVGTHTIKVSESLILRPGEACLTIAYMGTY